MANWSLYAGIFEWRGLSEAVVGRSRQVVALGRSLLIDVMGCLQGLIIVAVKETGGRWIQVVVKAGFTVPASYS